MIEKNRGGGCMPPAPPPESASGNVDGDIIMHKIPKDGAVKAAWFSNIKR